MKNEVLLNHPHFPDSEDPIPICSGSGEHSSDKKFRQSEFS